MHAKVIMIVSYLSKFKSKRCFRFNLFVIWVSPSLFLKIAHSLSVSVSIKDRIECNKFKGAGQGPTGGFEKVCS